jgi:hypothetical protein
MHLLVVKMMHTRVALYATKDFDLRLKWQPTLFPDQPKDAQQTGCRAIALPDPVTLVRNRAQQVQLSATFACNVLQMRTLLIPQCNWDAWLEKSKWCLLTRRS